MYWTCANNVFLWEYKTGSEVEVSPLSLEFARNYADGYGTSYAIYRFFNRHSPAPSKFIHALCLYLPLNLTLVIYLDTHTRFIISHLSLCKICRSPIDNV
jgi:hypothetical protein